MSVRFGVNFAVIACALFWAHAAGASSATFQITGRGINLGQSEEVEEDGQWFLRYRATIAVGQPFALTAQGSVSSRGGGTAAAEPESGDWTFDGKQFKKLDADAPAEATDVVIRLEATTPGVARVRFKGTILGYERSFEIVITISPGKPSSKPAM